MLRDLQRVVDHAESAGRSEDDFIVATELLLAKQFIWQDGHGQNKHYQLILQYREYFENLFDALGRDLIVDQKFGFCGWLPRNAKPSLPKLETIYLLILAKLHDVECRRACTENGRSMPAPGAITQTYCELTQQEKPARQRTYEALKRLEKQSIIRLGPIDEVSDLPRITVLPTIMAIVNSGYLEELERFAEEVIDEDAELKDEIIDTDAEIVEERVSELQENDQ